MIEYMDVYLILYAFMKVPRPKSSDMEPPEVVSPLLLHQHGMLRLRGGAPIAR